MIRDINNNNNPIATYPTILLQCNSITDLQTNYLIGFGNTVSYVNKIVKVLDSTGLPNSVVGLSAYYTIIAGISGNTSSQLQFLQSDILLPIPLTIALGGTNSTSILTNNKIMISNNNSITENTNVITPNTLVISDNNGLPSSSLITSAKVLNMVDKTGDTITGSLILNQDPTVPLGAVTKGYADTRTQMYTITATLGSGSITAAVANTFYPITPTNISLNTAMTSNYNATNSFDSTGLIHFIPSNLTPVYWNICANIYYTNLSKNTGTVNIQMTSDYTATNSNIATAQLSSNQSTSNISFLAPANADIHFYINYSMSVPDTVTISSIILDGVGIY